HLIDERKLFYVGTTRARELLVLGTADVVEKRGGGPSPFLEEMLGDDLAAATAAGKARILEVESARSASHEPRERVSFSTLAYFLQCPVKYQLAVVYGFEVVRPAPEDFGARLHMALREIHEMARAGLDLDDAARAGLALDDAALTAAVDAAWGPSSDADEATVRDAKRAAAEYLRRYVREHAGDFGRIAHVELPFSFRVEETIVTGRIDLLRSDGVGIEVVDFKTGESARGDEEGRQLEMQLGIYAIGAEAACGKTVTRRTAHFMRSGEVVTRPWDAEQAAAVREQLSGIIGSIAERRFAPRTTFCRRCDFHAVCRYGRDEHETIR
ncbi:MAG TPA: PD-(D/E)XK nuclease family protein, partial [Spirochaetia bacterium]